MAAAIEEQHNEAWLPEDEDGFFPKHKYRPFSLLRTACHRYYVSFLSDPSRGECSIPFVVPRIMF